MPIAPTPMTFDCPICGWRKSTAPESDALTSGNFFTCCAECGNPDLVIRKASALAAWLARLQKRRALNRSRKNTKSA